MEIVYIETSVLPTVCSSARHFIQLQPTIRSSTSQSLGTPFLALLSLAITQISSFLFVNIRGNHDEDSSITRCAGLCGFQRRHRLARLIYPQLRRMPFLPNTLGLSPSLIATLKQKPCISSVVTPPKCNGDLKCLCQSSDYLNAVDCYLENQCTNINVQRESLPDHNTSLRSCPKG